MPFSYLKTFFSKKSRVYAAKAVGKTPQIQTKTETKTVYVVLNPKLAYLRIQGSARNLQQEIAFKQHYILFTGLEHGKTTGVALPSLLQETIDRGQASFSWPEYGNVWNRNRDLRILFTRTLWEHGIKATHKRYVSDGPEANNIGIVFSLKGGEEDLEKIIKDLVGYWTESTPMDQEM